MLKFFTPKVVRQWNRLHRGTVDVPSLVQGQVGWDHEQLGLVDGNPALIRGLKMNRL